MKYVRWAGAGALTALAFAAFSGCGSRSRETSDAGADAAVDASDVDAADADAIAEPAPSTSDEIVPPPLPRSACPQEMVLVDNRVCVDRWESVLVDKNTGTLLSPYYPPNRKIALHIADTWEHERFKVGGTNAQMIGLPPLSAWQHANDPEPMAVSRAGSIPNGYVSGVVAETACANAGKRLCKQDEWVTACEGAAKQQFPYGEKYVFAACNIFRSKHPAAVLHDDASSGHLDPRLNLVTEGIDPLLRKTGATPKCGSVWGDDVIWDMNGNIDEWVDDEKGRFSGGFFSRSKKDGCLSSVGAHPKNYFDYSTGVRCCADPTR